MDKFQNKYRIPSARLKGWDYRWEATYFITICTKNREHYFGHIGNDSMVLSPLGVIADIIWHETKFHSPCVQLGEFIVMPNHVHCILILTDNEIVTNTETGISKDKNNDFCNGWRDRMNDGRGDGWRDGWRDGRDVACNVSTITDRNVNSITDRNDDINTVPDSAKNESMAAISPKPDSVSTIIRSYKSAVTKHAHRLGFDFEWQTRFHDHIIRNNDEYQRIADYIVNNPKLWDKDKFNE